MFNNIVEVLTRLDRSVYQLTNGGRRIVFFCRKSKDIVWEAEVPP